MTLKEFVAQMRADLDHFENNWLEEHEASPSDYPLEMDEGDWFEQLLSQWSS